VFAVAISHTAKRNKRILFWKKIVGDVDRWLYIESGAPLGGRENAAASAATPKSEHNGE